ARRGEGAQRLGRRRRRGSGLPRFVRPHLGAEARRHVGLRRRQGGEGRQVQGRHGCDLRTRRERRRHRQVLAENARGDRGEGREGQAGHRLGQDREHPDDGEVETRLTSTLGRMRRSTTGIVFVAVAAALWGMDAWIRQPLAASTAVATIVFGEHLVLVLCTLPFVAGALAAVVRLGIRHVLAAVVIGAGSSAVATILFTQAFVEGTDFVTPVVLQKVQPLVAVAAAAVVLGERPRPRFALFLVPALVGVWLIGVRHPLHPTVHGLKPALYALGAAVLWALGTVLGRCLARDLRFEHVTTLRFVFGLPASALA